MVNKAVLERDWDVEIKHISRWINVAADHLAKMSLSCLPGFQVLSKPDTLLAGIVERDKG